MFPPKFVVFLLLLILGSSPFPSYGQLLAPAALSYAPVAPIDPSSVPVAPSLVAPIDPSSIPVDPTSVPVDPTPGAVSSSLEPIYYSSPSRSSYSSVGDPAAPAAAYVTLSRPEDTTKPKKRSIHPFSTVAFGIKAGTLGASAEIATPLSRSFNLRSGINFAQFNYAFLIDGIHYETGVNFRSSQISLDWFPFHGGFHISPGVLYFHNGLAGAAHVSPAKPFTLDDVSYINSVDDPVGGSVSFKYSKHLAPSLMFGFSNLIPRNGAHISVPFEFGFAYTGAPTMDVKLLGTACTSQGCFNAATDPATQQNLKDELSDVDSKVRLAVVYPIVSLGFALRF